MICVVARGLEGSEKCLVVRQPKSAGAAEQGRINSGAVEYGSVTRKADPSRFRKGRERVPLEDRGKRDDSIDRKAESPPS